MYNDKQKLLKNIKDENIFQKHLPKQAELDKYMEKLKKKIINNYELPLTTKELIPEQKHSPFFKDIYKYVASGRIPSDVTGKAACILQRECENYLIAEGVLFQIRIPSEPNEEPELLLCIPENNHYHDTLLAAHQGVTRMYLTIKKILCTQGCLIIFEDMFKVVISVRKHITWKKDQKHTMLEYHLILDQ